MGKVVSMETPTIENNGCCICSSLGHYKHTYCIYAYMYFHMLPGRRFLQLELSNRSEPRGAVTPFMLLCVKPFCLAPEDEAVFEGHAQDEAGGNEEVRGKDVDEDEEVFGVRDPSAPNTMFSWLEICCSESAKRCTFTGTEREAKRNRGSRRR